MFRLRFYPDLNRPPKRTVGFELRYSGHRYAMKTRTPGPRPSWNAAGPALASTEDNETKVLAVVVFVPFGWSFVHRFREQHWPGRGGRIVWRPAAEGAGGVLLRPAQPCERHGLVVPELWR